MSLLVTLVSLLLVFWIAYHTIVFPIFLSPLSTVPSIHWSAKSSCLYSLYIRYKGTELSNLVKAHQKHGPLVQVGPRDLSVNCYQGGVVKIYDAGFEKPPAWYSLFNYFGSGMGLQLQNASRNANAFTSLTRRDHGMRRRRTAGLYSKAALLGSHHMYDVSHTIVHTRLMPRLKEAALRNAEVDALELVYSLCADYLSSFLFGLCNSTDYLSQDKSVNDEWRLHYENLGCRETFFRQELPGIFEVCSRLGIDMLPTSYYEAKTFLEEWVTGMTCKADRAIHQRKATGDIERPVDQPVIYEATKNAVEKDSSHLDIETRRKEVASEMFDHISASREVLGLVLAYTFWYLAKNLRVQECIRGELASAGICTEVFANEGPHESMNLPSILSKLPYLNAVIHESLRMRPTSTLLPRLSPSDRFVSVAGYVIPPATRVNTFQWFVHRDPSKWDRVDEFLPERWLGRDAKNSQREDVLWPFASGPRMCLGNNWTYYAMGYVIASVMSSFKFEAGARRKVNCWPGSPDDYLPMKVQLTQVR